MRQVLRIFFLVFVSIHLMGAGFTPSHEIGINSLSSNYIPGLRYSIATQQSEHDSLQYAEFTNHIRRALDLLGYTYVQNYGDSDVIVSFNYAISDPRTVSGVYTRPVYGPTGSFSYTVGGRPHNLVRGQTFNLPQYGVVRTRDSQKSITLYARTIEIEAYDTKSYITRNEKIQVWKTELVSSGTSSDLRKFFPIMIAASLPYLGKNTGQQIVVRINEGDEKVFQVRGY